MSDSECSTKPTREQWQAELQHVVTSPDELFDLLALDKSLLNTSSLAHQQFQLRSTRSYISRIKKGDWNDPLLQQILPTHREMEKVDGFVADPLSETSTNPRKGLLHKYKSRVLFIVATQCAINCRYCFRRHFPYDDNKASRAQWLEAVNYISDDKQINEVIFSGGDPLVLGDRQLAWLADKIAEVPHVLRLRIHSRLPIVLPNRVCPEFLAWLSSSRLKPVVVVHCNHPQEISPEVERALKQLSAAGVTVLNQAVLLKGINDDVATQVALSEALFSADVLPYYLYLLDAVAGAAHFDVDESQAKALHKQLLAELPGYLVPKLMREIPGEQSKTPII